MSTARLTRSETDRVVGGVCGGLATYLGLNANLIRLSFILLTLASATGLVLYLLLLIIMPRESQTLTKENISWQDNLGDLGDSLSGEVKKAVQDPRQRNWGAILLIALGLYFLLAQLGLYSGGLLHPFFLAILVIIIVARSRRD